MKNDRVMFELELTKDEITQLATWHKECELRFVGMREYQMADEHKQRLYLFEGLKNTGKFLSGR